MGASDDFIAGELPGTAPLSAPALAPAAARGPAPVQPGAEAPAPAPADADAAWSTAFGAPNVGSRPNVVAVDGDVVYLGGSFIDPMAGMPERTYNCVARWDGTGWQRMGAGVDAPVNALAVAGKDVYAGGEFTTAGGRVAARRLARWDGTEWFAVAGGVASRAQPDFASVRALAWDGTRLYVAGVFDTAGAGRAAVPANGFAALTPATGRWETFEGGLWFLGGPGEGRALLLAGGRLYVGGYFDAAGGVETGSLAALDLRTGRWTGFGQGIRNGDFVGSVESLAHDERTGTVFAGGSFTAAGAVEASGVATLAGEELGSLGAFTRYGDPASASVAALAFSAGRLYAGGVFTAAGEAAAEHWAVHDGTAWAQPAELNNDVFALAAHRDGVVVGGDFVSSGDVRLPHAAIWTGAQWQTFGQGVTYDEYADGYVYAIAATDAAIYAGGYFDQAGPVRCGSVAAWSGGAWDALAGGVRGANPVADVYALLVLENDLYVTGTFGSAGEGAAANIARWDGERWHALGSGLNGTGYALAVLGGRLYVGGEFTAAGGVPAGGVAAWDPGTATWSGLGNVPMLDARVLGLAVIRDRYLVIGGQFNAFRAANTDLRRGLNGLTLFDTQAPVTPEDPLAGFRLVAGVQQSYGTGTVRALQVLGGDLFVGGTFDTAGVVQLADPPQAGFAARNLAVWHFGADGTWETPGATDEPVMALATLEGRVLVVGGWFGAAGPIAASGVAEYDSAAGTWAAYGSGLGPGERGVRQVEALAQRPADGLWVGGRFDTAGGAPSCALANWRATAGRRP